MRYSAPHHSKPVKDSTKLLAQAQTDGAKANAAFTNPYGVSNEFI